MKAFTMAAVLAATVALPSVGTQKFKTSPPIATMRQEKPRRARIVSCRQKRTTALPQAIRVHTAAGGSNRS